MSADQDIDPETQALLDHIAQIDEENGMSTERQLREHFGAYTYRGRGEAAEPRKKPSKMAARRKIRRQAQQRKAAMQAALATVGIDNTVPQMVVPAKRHKKTSRQNVGTQKGRWSRRNHKPSTKPARLAVAA